jgi:RNA polymerase sigma-70 factor (ECF subfamily)
MIDKRELVKLLEVEPEKALKIIYKDNFKYLCSIVYRLYPDWNVAEDVVQDVFLEVWKKRKTIDFNIKIRPYFRKAVINKALNRIRDNRIILDDEGKASSIKSEVYSGLQNLEQEELKDRIDKAIHTLPKKCRIIFGMSRFEDMTYSEIASELGISVKTVENQISKALKILRDKLKDN